MMWKLQGEVNMRAYMPPWGACGPCYCVRPMQFEMDFVMCRTWTMPICFVCLPWSMGGPVVGLGDAYACAMHDIQQAKALVRSACGHGGPKIQGIFYLSWIIFSVFFICVCALFKSIFLYLYRYISQVKCYDIPCLENPWVYGFGYHALKPMPANPLGLAFCPLTNPWVEKLTQTHALIS